MSLSGTDLALTPARAAQLRSAAGRSGWPVLLGARVPLYALSDVARSGATRSGYTSPLTFIAVGGVEVGIGFADPAMRVLLDSLRITDSLDEAPNTATMRMRGPVPTMGQAVVVRLGSVNNLAPHFAGRVLQARQTYLLQPAHVVHDLSLIDHTWGLDTRVVTARYTGSASTIAAALLAAYAPGYTAIGVQAGLPTVEGGITFTNQRLSSCLTQLAKRIGAYWYIDYHADLHLFIGTDATIGSPGIVNAVNPTLQLDPPVAITRDLSQMITRVYVEGGGSDTLEAVAVGETVIPVANADWYLPGGGVVVAGPQRIAYSRRDLGGGGSVVGPGAAPSVAPVVALLGGAGLESGAHAYAVTFVTAAGESLPGPRVSIVVGAVAPPATAPTIGAATSAGDGPAAGAHTYAVTFVTAAGETSAGVSVDAAPTGLVTPPTTAPSASPIAGVGIEDGVHEYAVAYTTPTGSTTVGPVGNAATTTSTPAGIANPSTAPAAALADGGAVDVGAHTYAVTFVTTAGESLPSPLSNSVTPTTGITASATAPGAGPFANASAVYPAGTYRFRVTFKKTGVESGGSPASVAVTTNGTTDGVYVTIPAAPAGPAPDSYELYVSPNGAAYQFYLSFAAPGSYYDLPVVALGAVMPTIRQQAVPLSSLPLGPSGTTSRWIYRTAAGGAQLKRLIAIDTVVTTFKDVYADTTLGANAPVAQSRVSVSNIPDGPTGVTRALYRRSNGAGLKFVATLPAGSTYTDTLPSSSLGAAPPSTNTATLNQLRLSAIPLGGSLVTARKIYRTAVGSAQLQLAHTLANNTETTWVDIVNDASLGANVPTTNTAVANQVSLASIPLGGAGTTARKVYRTAAGATPLKLLTTLADNSTTTLTDSASDGALGATAPIVDTSMLTMADGLVLAGATTIPAAGTGWAQAAGGWAIIGNGQQVVRYTGVTATSLTGVPATGVGAVTATVSFNSSITAAPSLLGIPAAGVGSVREPILRGDEVNLWIQVDDIDAQAVLAALLDTDGIQEDFIQDRRLAVAEATARGQAHLALRNQVTVGIKYRTTDRSTRAGQTVAINLGPPTSLVGDFKIQQVTIADFRETTNPMCDVDASTDRFSFEDLLRMARS